MKKFIFDVDGTLTESRKYMDISFMSEFIIFCCKFDTYLVTGSDRDKTVEQVGLDVYNRAKRVFNCSGADIYEKDFNIYKSDWKLPDEVKRFLQDELDYSQFPLKTGNHIEERAGGVNFSILGRNALFEEREIYQEWDEIHDERIDIADRIKNEFPDLNVLVGGQTGLDISNDDMSEVQPGAKKTELKKAFGKMSSGKRNSRPVLNKFVGMIA